MTGNKLANLDDAAPSGEDFTNLEKRVTKIEQGEFRPTSSIY